MQALEPISRSVKENHELPLNAYKQAIEIGKRGSGTLLHSYNPSTSEAEAGGSQV